MRKRIIPFVATVLSATIMLSGCSCNPTVPLAFNNAFNGGENAHYPYSETTEYSVSLIDSYESYFAKNAQITDEVLKYDINGTYKTTLEIIDKSSLPSSITSNVLEEDIGNELYHLTTSLNLTAEYSAPYEIYQESDGSKVKEKTFNDVIVTESYFLSSGLSFAPIYSTTQGQTSLVSVNAEHKAAVSSMTFLYKTVYDKNEYTVSTKFDDNEEQIDDYGYDFKTLIDNNTLLFAIRNISVELDSSYSLPTLSPVYKSKQTLTVKNIDERSETVTINGQKTENVPVKELCFSRNDKSNTGTPQYVVIQKDKAGNLDSNALLLEYTEPLISYGSFLCLGGLRYTLTSHQKTK